MWNQCAVPSARLDCGGGRRRRARQAGAAKARFAFVVVGQGVCSLCIGLICHSVVLTNKVE